MGQRAFIETNMLDDGVLHRVSEMEGLGLAEAAAEST